MHEVMRAIQFGIGVELHPELRFSGKDLVVMLVKRAKLRRFIDLRYNDDCGAVCRNYTCLRG